MRNAQGFQGQSPRQAEPISRFVASYDTTANTKLEYIRYIRPKGYTFDDLSQDDVTLMMNHINSMPRASLNGKAPVQVFRSLYGEETVTRLGLKYIPLEELLLKPSLLKK